MKKITLIFLLALVTACANAQTKTMRILFGVVPSVVTSQGGPAGTNSTLNVAINLLNASFPQSGIPYVNSQQVGGSYANIPEFSSLEAAIAWARSDYRLNYTRDIQGADMIVLITNTPSSAECGLAPVYADAFSAVAAVSVECIPTHSIQHEIGHLIGLRHDTLRDGSSVPYPAGHGYYNATKFTYPPGPAYCPAFHTIMSYSIPGPLPSPCIDTRINFWSNQFATYGSYPTGYGAPGGFGSVPMGNIYADERGVFNATARMAEVTDWHNTSTSPPLLAQLLAPIFSSLD